jgi:hypothetical protein
MIAALSSTWGITALSDGKLVWATFDLTDAPGRRTIRGTAP